jgi:hypothetical protein
MTDSKRLPLNPWQALAAAPFFPPYKERRAHCPFCLQLVPKADASACCPGWADVRAYSDDLKKHLKPDDDPDDGE